ncbi:alpha/beta hydrolase [Microbulbifer litoralis]|uniref:alpha/beta hydrolase n=1 Tax=Microbulbifer litoralis TaxID=2933965 RepID=UPI0020282CE9|nr:alpha/beta hydrolase-fold protein [Microbulbifer sp. GX H0434]
MPPSTSIDRRRLLQLLLAATALPAASRAQPDLSRTMGRTLADRGSAHYRFETFALQSADGQRHYRVWLAIPRGGSPASGFPSLYLLDGNAVLHHLRERWLQPLMQAEPPVLVMVGYDTEKLFDVTARQRDYTPAAPGEDIAVDPRWPDRPGGGAAAFLQLLEQRIKPEVARRVPLDSDRQSLWGHSFGGLFTLFALCNRAGFKNYIPVSPALYWHRHVIGRYVARLQATPAGTRLWLARGDREARVPRDATAEQAAAIRRRASAEFTAAREALAGTAGLEIHSHEFPGLGHGEALVASLPRALRIAAGIPAGHGLMERPHEL